MSQNIQTKQEELLLYYIEGGNCNLTLAHPLLDAGGKTVPTDLGQMKPASAATNNYLSTEDASLDLVAASCVLVSMSAKFVSVGSYVTCTAFEAITSRQK